MSNVSGARGTRLPLTIDAGPCWTAPCTRGLRPRSYSRGVMVLMSSCSHPQSGVLQEHDQYSNGVYANAKPVVIRPSLYTYYIPRSRTTMARGHVRPYAAVMTNRMVSSLRHHTSGMSRGRPTGDRSSDLHTECWRSTGRATAMAYWLQAEP